MFTVCSLFTKEREPCMYAKVKKQNKLKRTKKRKMRETVKTFGGSLCIIVIKMPTTACWITKHVQFKPLLSSVYVHTGWHESALPSVKQGGNTVYLWGLSWAGELIHTVNMTEVQLLFLRAWEKIWRILHKQGTCEKGEKDASFKRNIYTAHSSYSAGVYRMNDCPTASFLVSPLPVIPTFGFELKVMSSSGPRRP